MSWSRQLCTTTLNSTIISFCLKKRLRSHTFIASYFDYNRSHDRDANEQASAGAAELFRGTGRRWEAHFTRRQDVRAAVGTATGEMNDLKCVVFMQ